MIKSTNKFAVRRLAVVGLAAVLLYSCGGGSPGDNPGDSSNPTSYGIEGSGLRSLPPPPPKDTVVSCGPQSITVAPMGLVAYVANDGCGSGILGSVSVYTIDATSGALASTGPPVSTNDEGAHSVVVSSSGRFVYVANWGGGDTAGSVAAYTINVTTGALTLTGSTVAPCDPPPSPGGCGPWSVAVHPSGDFVYVANEGGYFQSGVSWYRVDPNTGTLGSTGIVGVGAQEWATVVAVDPSGKFAYVASDPTPQSVGAVTTCTIDPITGALTVVGSVAGGAYDSMEIRYTSIAVHPSGKFVYATRSSDVFTYAVDSNTGLLTSVVTTAESFPTSIAIDPSGQFAYVTNSSNELSTYAINLTTGALTFQSVTGTGAGPTSIAIHPSGKFAYVTNSGSNDVWAYSIDSVTGALTFINSITD